MTAAFGSILVAWMVVAGVTFLLLFRVVAPYGRHIRAGWGPTVPHRLGWFAMEVVSPAALLVAWSSGSHPGGRGDPWVVLFVGLWCLHYLYRAMLYPLLSRWEGRRMPLAIMASAVFFNAVNGGLNGFWFGHLAPRYPDDWAADPRFLAGAGLFVLGAAIHVVADATLRRLRQPGQRTYAIPRGGLYRWISCPNYLGELVEWVGYALMTWSPAAATFAIWTLANLMPRAVAHHRWYRERFPDYPRNRRAMLPGIL